MDLSANFPGVMLHNMVINNPDLFRFALLFRAYTQQLHDRAISHYTQKRVMPNGETRYLFRNRFHRPLLEGPAVESEGYGAWYSFGKLHHTRTKMLLTTYPAGKLAGRWFEFPHGRQERIYTLTELNAKIFVLHKVWMAVFLIIGIVLGVGFVILQMVFNPQILHQDDNSVESL